MSYPVALKAQSADQPVDQPVDQTPAPPAPAYVPGAASGTGQGTGEHYPWGYHRYWHHRHHYGTYGYGTYGVPPADAPAGEIHVPAPSYGAPAVAPAPAVMPPAAPTQVLLQRPAPVLPPPAAPAPVMAAPMPLSPPPPSPAAAAPVAGVAAAPLAPMPQHALVPTSIIANMKAPDGAGLQGGAGEGLTPMGAIRAGNADGTVPAWTGGLTAAGTNHAGRVHADPFAGERPLFSITAQNVDRYADRLAAGTAAMIRTISGYHVDVYPTHRTAAAPHFIYDNAVTNIGRAHLVHGGQGVEGAALSVPFPVPHNGSEAVWNHILRWRGTQIVRTVTNVISAPGGDYALQRWHEDIMLPYNTPGFVNPALWDSLFRQEVLAPPRDAGALTLVINHQNPYDQAREAWSYNPGERRVRRAPDIDYDTPLTDTDGLETVDDYDMFNGALDRYEWTLMGRREMYVPYNTNRLQDPSVRPADLIGREAINPDYIRFELHRVWVVEAKLRPEFRHIYSRRTLYLDEDSWQCLVADKYDGRGNLWRTAMAFPVEMPEVPLLVADGYEYVDLYQHRYLMQGLHGQEPEQPVYNATWLTPRDYTAEALRRMGHR
jgi:hypothetical protein